MPSSDTTSATTSISLASTISTTNNGGAGGHPSRRSSSSPATQACAACKFQRRKCQPDCILAPYFPAHAQRQFSNAHKLFGVSNILKIIRDRSPAERTEAMRSIIFESNARANDPIGGCYRIIVELDQLHRGLQAELAHVYRQLAIAAAQAQQQSSQPIDLSINSNILPESDDPNGQFIPMQLQEQPQQQHLDYLDYQGGGDDNKNNNVENSNNNISGSNSNNSVNNENGSNNNNNERRYELDMEVPAIGMSMLNLQEQYGAGEVNDVKPDILDVRHPFAIRDDDEESRDVGTLDCKR